MKRADQILDELKAVLPSGYTIDGTLDEGGQGAVYLGTYKREKVALKLFDRLSDTRRVQRELKALQQLDCPNLVKVRATDIVVVHGNPCPLVAYEYCPGGDLLRLVNAAGTITPITLCAIGEQISNAIEALWGIRVVHRDVKPANIVAADSGRYVLVDVGFARHLDLSDLTAFGGAPGTPGYKSPEQALGRRNLTIKSDIFSLGITLYQLASKRHPFNCNQALIGRIEPSPLATIRGDLPPKLASLIDQMMAVVAVDRPSNLRDRFRSLRGDS